MEKEKSYEGVYVPADPVKNGAPKRLRSGILIRNPNYCVGKSLAGNSAQALGRGQLMNVRDASQSFSSLVMYNGKSYVPVPVENGAPKRVRFGGLIRTSANSTSASASGNAHERGQITNARATSSQSSSLFNLPIYGNGKSHHVYGKVEDAPDALTLPQSNFSSSDDSEEESWRAKANYVTINNTATVTKNFDETGAAEKGEAPEKKEPEARKCSRIFKVVRVAVRPRPYAECFECGLKGHYVRDCDDLITRDMEKKDYNHEDQAQRDVFYLLRETKRLREQSRRRKNKTIELGREMQDLKRKLFCVEEASKKLKDALELPPYGQPTWNDQEL